MNESAEHQSIPAGDAADEVGFDARTAADLLRRTEHDAAREFQPRAPLFVALCGVLVFAAYGALWLSVHRQHPYVGPSLGVIGVVYGLVILCGVTGGALYRRARSGVSGRTRHDERLMGLAFLPGIVGVYVFAAALKFDGYPPSLTVGVFDAAGPWLVVGTAMVAHAVAREDWWRAAGGTGVIAVAVAAAFSGADNVWGVLAVGALVLFGASSLLRAVMSRTLLA